MAPSQPAAQSAQQFFKGASRFAVAGASSDRNKYGNKVLVRHTHPVLEIVRPDLLMPCKNLQRWYQDRSLAVTPINPKSSVIEGLDVATCLSDVAKPNVAAAFAVSIITPPAVTTKIVQEAHALGISRVWMQPGSESEEAVQFGEDHDMIVVHNCCILVSGDSARSQACKI